MNPRRYFHESRVPGPFLRWIVPAVVTPPRRRGFRRFRGIRADDVDRSARHEARPVRPGVDRRDPGARPLAVTGGPRRPVHPLSPDSKAIRCDGRSRIAVGRAPPLRPLSSHRLPPPPRRRSTAASRALATPLTPQGDVIPPDTMGAAGPNHLVSLLNSDFGVFDKTTGAELQKISLQSFWGSLVTPAGEPADFPFDPKILYDQHSGRFIAVTLDGTVAPNSWLMVAVSSTSDPTGAWDKWAIDADRDNDVQLFNECTADFPGLGVDAFNVYVTANMFRRRRHRPVQQSVGHPESPAADRTRAPPSRGSNSTIPWHHDFTMQPAHTFGTAAAEYRRLRGIVQRQPPARGLDRQRLRHPGLHSPVSGSVTPYTSTSFLPGAPQLGNRQHHRHGGHARAELRVPERLGLDHPPRRRPRAERSRSPGTGSTREPARWSRRDASTDPSRWYYYPSIAVNKDNVAAIGFSGSSTTEFVGGYYTVIQPSTGAAEAVALLKAGEAPYFKAFRGSENRWGDFSATTVDPADDTSFWTLQEYAMTHDTFTDNNNNVVDRSRWGTWWGKFTPGTAQPPSPSSGGGGGGGGCLSISRAPRREDRCILGRLRRFPVLPCGRIWLETGCPVPRYPLKPAWHPAC